MGEVRWSARRVAAVLATVFFVACSSDSGAGGGTGADLPRLEELGADGVAEVGTGDLPIEDQAPGDASGGGADPASDLAPEDADDRDGTGGEDGPEADAVDAEEGADARDLGSVDLGGALPRRILVLGPASAQPQAIAQHLGALAEADPALAGMAVAAEAYSQGELLSYHYAWTGREERLARLDEGWDAVVIIEGRPLATMAPELHFEGVRGVAERVRAAGAIPVLLVSEPVPYVFAEPVDGQRCSDFCRFAVDGDCDDGGPGADFMVCELGTDCVDCGPRPAEASPAALLLDHSYRVGNGTGSVVVPASYASHLAFAGSAEWPVVAAVSLYTAMVGRDASALVPALEGVDAARWRELAEAALAAQQEADRTVWYTGPFRGSVRIESLDPLPGTFRVMTSGTSSEAGYATAMRALLTREGVAHAVTEIGNCNDFRSFDSVCLARAATHFDDNEFHVLYARYYDVDDADIRATGPQPALQAQAYDRHWDETGNDGRSALDEIYDRTMYVYEPARRRGVAFLPQHINFARLKLEVPAANLLSDGTHATSAVQAGLAAMSYVARTGRSPGRASLSGEAEAAVRLGELTVRQLAALSTTGEHIPDVPSERPRLRVPPR